MNNPIQNIKNTIVKKTLDKPIELKKETPKTPVKSEAPSNVPPIDTGINLIPTLTKEEVVIEEKKKKLNVSSIVSLLILVVVSILIVGFNIISKLQVNNEKKVLSTYENSLQNSTQKIISSNEITDRVFLYQDIEGQTYSPKKVVEYLNAIATKSGNANITKFNLGNDLSFTIDGNASDLENVAKLWYLLGNDPEILEINLKSVSNGSNKATFSFEGSMVFEYFLSSAN